LLGESLSDYGLLIDSLVAHHEEWLVVDRVVCQKEDFVKSSSKASKATISNTSNRTILDSSSQIRITFTGVDSIGKATSREVAVLEVVWGWQPPPGQSRSQYC
jgi:hypothetical protein